VRVVCLALQATVAPLGPTYASQTRRLAPTAGALVLRASAWCARLLLCAPFFTSHAFGSRSTCRALLLWHSTSCCGVSMSVTRLTVTNVTAAVSGGIAWLTNFNANGGECASSDGWLLRAPVSDTLRSTDVASLRPLLICRRHLHVRHGGHQRHRHRARQRRRLCGERAECLHSQQLQLE